MKQMTSQLGTTGSALANQSRSEVTAVLEEESHQFLTFQVAGERYAVGILDVKEIIEISEMTRMPMTPDFIRGVINLRGNVVVVVDLGVRLGKGRSELGKRSSIVLVEVASHGGGQQLIGMLVDEVREILEIPTNHLQPPPDFGSQIRTDFIHAMGRVNETFMILLDINHVLSVDELAHIQNVAEAGTAVAAAQAD
jgi:purine-binding chemotaxis protein CheW